MRSQVERPAKKRGICVDKMADGDVAEIVEWGEGKGQVGRAVVRVGRRIQEIGSRAFWDYVTGPDNRNEDLRVELLKPGDIIHIVE